MQDGCTVLWHICRLVSCCGGFCGDEEGLPTLRFQKSVLTMCTGSECFPADSFSKLSPVLPRTLHRDLVGWPVHGFAERKDSSFFVLPGSIHHINAAMLHRKRAWGHAVLSMLGRRAWDSIFSLHQEPNYLLIWDWTPCTTDSAWAW